jgi:hypothetical protein
MFLAQKISFLIIIFFIVKKPAMYGPSEIIHISRGKKGNEHKSLSLLSLSLSSLFPPSLYFSPPSL